MLPIQLGAIPATYANVDTLIKCVGGELETSIEEGRGHFVTRYRKFYLEYKTEALWLRGKGESRNS